MVTCKKKQIHTGLLVVIVSFEENGSEVEFIHILVVPTLACYQDLFALEFQMLICLKASPFSSRLSNSHLIFICFYKCVPLCSQSICHKKSVRPALHGVVMVSSFPHSRL